MAFLPPKIVRYEYHHYPKQVKNDDPSKEDIVVKDAKDHWKFARKDYEQDEIAKEQFIPSAYDEKDENNLLQLKPKKKEKNIQNTEQNMITQSDKDQADIGA